LRTKAVDLAFGFKALELQSFKAFKALKPLKLQAGSKAFRR
jgi:hypothetical protein